MRSRARRFVTLFFALCLCFAMLFAAPVSASADDGEITSVLLSLNYVPVIYMDLQYVNVSCSASTHYITSYGWYDASGNAVGSQFARGVYTLQVNYAAADGYRFAADAVGYINNQTDSGISVSVSADGGTALLTKSFEAEIWAPVAIKDPGNAVVDAGGWASFVVSSMYTDEDQWYLVDPEGHAFTMAQAVEKFPQLDYSGENTDKLILRNIPAGLDGWSVFCRHWSVDKISYSQSKNGSITVNGAAEPSPTPAPAPTPSPTPTPAPSPTPTPDPAADAADGSDKSGTVFQAAWSSDSDYHWHDSADGKEISGKAPHSLVWREKTPAAKDAPGEEEGVCSICGYTTSRALDSTGNEPGQINLSTFRVVLYLILAALVLGLVVLVASALTAPRKKKKHRKG